MARILKDSGRGEQVAELAWSASSASPQLTLFPMGLSGIGMGSQLTKGTGSLVPKGCALTHSCGEVTVLEKGWGFIRRLVKSG